MIGAFGRKVVLAAGMDPALGRALNAVELQRQVADYRSVPPSLEDAAAAVGAAETFVAAIEARFAAAP